MSRKFIKKIEEIMKSGHVDDNLFSFEKFLYICSKIYSLGVNTRGLLYKAGLLKSKKLPCFVISIGNITAGGTGKTPMTMYVARLIRKFGYKPAIVTRGYKGAYSAPQAVVSDGRQFFLDVREAGDEAFMMAEELPIPVIVGKNRYEAGMLAIKEFNPDVIILDDGFQHIALQRDFNLLLCDCKRPFGNFYLIPRGQLREPVKACLRSDAVIYTRSGKQHEAGREQFKAENGFSYIESKPVFLTKHSPYVAKAAGSNRTGDNKINSSFDIAEENPSGFLFSAIADNSDFRSTCREMGIIEKGYTPFLDHHSYTEEELTGIYNQYKKSRADYLVTTQKDYVKIKGILPEDFPLIVIGIEITFKTEHKEKFDNLIKSKIIEYKKYQ